MTDQDRAQDAEPTRPKPQYGELAPEGWSWSPEGGGDPSTGPSAQPADPSSQAARPSVGPIPGVPHNLGASGERAARPASAGSAPAAPSSQPSSTPNDPQPYRAAPPQAPQAPQVQPQQAAPPHQGSTPAQAQTVSRSSVDRIITILLLVLGALGALYFAASLYQMPSSLVMVGGMLGAEDIVVPAGVTTLGNVGAIVLLALYALTLIYSLQRLRARKLAFWVPLAAGALALIITLVFTMMGMMQTPELMSLLSDPDSTGKLLGG